MYIAIEGTNSLLNQTIFECCLKASTNTQDKPDIFHPLKPMPEYTWWEQAKEKFSTNPIFNSELLIARAKYHLKYSDIHQMGLPKNWLLGIGSVMANIVESWPAQSLVSHAHVSNVLAELINLPLPTDIIYVHDGRANDPVELEKHQHYLYIFENLKNYGFDQINIHYIDQSIIESNQVEHYCQQLFDTVRH